MYIDAELTNAVDYSAIATTLPGGAGANLTALATPGVCPGAVTGISPLVGGGSNCEGVAKVKGDDWGWGWNLGAMINLSPDTRIGLAYRSTVTQKLDGDVTFSNRPATAAFAAAVPNSGVSAEIKLPDLFSVGVSHALDRARCSPTTPGRAGIRSRTSPSCAARELPWRIRRSSSRTAGARGWG